MVTDGPPLFSLDTASSLRSLSGGMTSKTSHLRNFQQSQNTLLASAHALLKFPFFNRKLATVASVATLTYVASITRGLVTSLLHVRTLATRSICLFRYVV